MPDNDVDIICSKNWRGQIREVIGALAQRYGGVQPQLIWYACGSFCHILYFPLSGGRRAYIKLDFCEDFVVDGRKLLSADWLLEGRRRFDRPITFHACAPEKEFAYYLLKKLGKGEASATAQAHLARLMAERPAECQEVLARFWPEKAAALIERAIASQNWAPIVSDIGRLQEQLYRRLPKSGPRIWLAERARRAWRLLRPTGFVIAVLGPDGAGKSTLLDLLPQQMTGFEDRFMRFHLTPPLFKGSTASPPVDDPHGKPARGFWPSVFKLIYLAALYDLGWLASVWLPVRRSAMIFFDRYYHDILADPLRYRNGAPRWVVHALGHLIPTPDLFLVLDVSPEVARARKAEVSAEESVRQFAAYRALCRELPNAHLIDAAQSPADVASACEEAIVRAMDQRYAPA